MKQIIICSLFIIVAGCSNRGIYENMQANNRLECAELQFFQYEECMEKTNKSYDEYRRERQEAMDR